MYNWWRDFALGETILKRFERVSFLFDTIWGFLSGRVLYSFWNILVGINVQVSYDGIEIENLIRRATLSYFNFLPVSPIVFRDKMLHELKRN